MSSATISLTRNLLSLDVPTTHGLSPQYEREIQANMPHEAPFCSASDVRLNLGLTLNLQHPSSSLLFSIILI